MEKEIKRLPLEFKGKGDTRNYYYICVYMHKCSDGKYAYIYKQVEGEYTAGYEVVKPIVKEDGTIEVVDGKKLFVKFENLKEYYPSSEQWGINGFTCKTLNDAMKKIAVFS